MATTTNTTVSAPAATKTTAAPKVAVKAATKRTPAKTAAPKVAQAPKSAKVVGIVEEKKAPKVVATPDEIESIRTANGKAPSELHKNFQTWLEAAGVDDLDLETIKLVCALRHTFQKSQFNQDHLEGRKEAADKKAEARILAAKLRAEKAVAKAKALEAAAKKDAAKK